VTIYITPIEALVIHRTLIDRFGGSQGLRDAGALESALFRPQSGYYEDAIQQAAALWESMTNNHAFIDGNKRIGFAVTDIFLRINGCRITANADDIFELIDGLLETGEFEYKNLEAWLRKNTKKTGGK
jgi:death-on-curing protein